MMKIITLVADFIWSGLLVGSVYGLESFFANWSVFKTQTKTGVSGTFEKPNLESKKNVDDGFLWVLTTSTVHINAATVKTGNEKGDATIVIAFFKNMIEDGFIDTIIKPIDMQRKE